MNKRNGVFLVFWWLFLGGCAHTNVTLLTENTKAPIVVQYETLCWSNDTLIAMNQFYAPESTIVSMRRRTEFSSFLGAIGGFYAGAAAGTVAGLFYSGIACNSKSDENDVFLSDAEACKIQISFFSSLIFATAGAFYGAYNWSNWQVNRSRIPNCEMLK